MSSEGVQIDNFQLKIFLSHRFDKVIFWTYPRNQSMSKMFFFTSIDLADLVEILTQENGTLSIRQSAKIPREELKIYDLNLCKSYYNSNDCQISMDMFRNNRPGGWIIFSNIFLVLNHIQNSNYIRKQAYLWHFVSNLLWIDCWHSVCDEFCRTYAWCVLLEACDYIC